VLLARLAVAAVKQTMTGMTRAVTAPQALVVAQRTPGFLMVLARTLIAAVTTELVMILSRRRALAEAVA
jgi:hypothetical protein